MRIRVRLRNSSLSIKEHFLQLTGGVAFFFFGASDAWALPQIVTLKTGETVIGEVLSKSDDSTLYLKSDLLGELSIARSSIDSSVPQKTEKKVQIVEPKKTLAAKEVTPKEEGQAEEAPLSTQIIDTLKEIEAPKSWAGSFKIGLNSSQGDRKWDETYTRGDLKVEEKGSPHYFRLNGSYTYRLSERNDGTEVKSNDRYDGTFTYRRSFLGNWFAQNATGYRADQLKGINREIQNVVGLGYRLTLGPKFEVVFGGGGGIEYFDADFEEEQTNDMVVNLFQEFSYKPTKRTSFIQEFKYFQNPDDPQNYNYLFKTAVRIRLTNLLGFEISYNKDFDNEVQNDVEDNTQFRNALVVFF
ncbi:MAG: DUF481 domain-containing protein [Verrucomicrobiota bacterium]